MEDNIFNRRMDKFEEKLDKLIDFFQATKDELSELKHQNFGGKLQETNSKIEKIREDVDEVTRAMEILKAQNHEKRLAEAEVKLIEVRIFMLKVIYIATGVNATLAILWTVFGHKLQSLF
jgi:archaellum component FlaC